MKMLQVSFFVSTKRPKLAFYIKAFFRGFQLSKLDGLKLKVEARRLSPSSKKVRNFFLFFKKSVLKIRSHAEFLCFAGCSTHPNPPYSLFLYSGYEMRSTWAFLPLRKLKKFKNKKI